MNTQALAHRLDFLRRQASELRDSGGDEELSHAADLELEAEEIEDHIYNGSDE
jgi:hypothetical protein